MIALKARQICAIVGIAIAVATVQFMESLVATNDHQAEAIAGRLVEEVPVCTTSSVSRLALDYRPNGRVMQGPPLFVVANDGAEDLADSTCRITRALFAQRKLEVPPVGSELTLVGRRGTYKVVIAEVVDWDRPVRGYPNLFINQSTAAQIGEEWIAWEPPADEALVSSLRSDEGRNFDRAKALLLWAAALTALCLLVNALFLSIEARRRQLAILRLVGMTRGGIVRLVFAESLVLAAVGWAVGCSLASGLLRLWVAWNAELFPLGARDALTSGGWSLVATGAVSLLAALIALRPALRVKPLELACARPARRHHLGMILSFAFGFGAFVAVEVWGSSLMRAFVPSPEWPDAIVSILPGGISSFDIDRLQQIEGVRRLAELQPLQVNFSPLEEMEMPRGGEAPSRRGPAYRNALLLASDWLPAFRFTSGDRDSAENAIKTSDACVITEMMARARKLAMGDTLALDCGRGLVMSLKVVGIVDLNWHMVTSRGLVRGMNRMPVNTDGPLFVSFDTLAACDPRPQEFVKMTHLWLDYKDSFVREHGAFEAGRLVERRIVEALSGAYEVTEGGEVLGNTVRLHSRDEIAEGTFAHGDDLIGAMARVPFIFIAVLSLGFIALLVASADARKREFKVLRTVGATRAQLAGLLIREALAVAGWGLVLGLVGGAFAGWLFTFATRSLMANWGLPASFAVPGLTLCEGALGAVLFALVVSVPTSLILLRRTR